MATVYEVDVRVGLSDAVSAGLNSISGALHNIGTSQREAQSAMQQMREEGQQMHRAFQDIFVGHVISQWGESGLRAIGGMVHAAGDLESAMLSVGAATGMGADQLRRMRDFTQQLAGTHTFSSTQAALMETIVGKTTFKDPEQIQSILGARGGLGDFADVMGPGGAKLMGTEEAARLGMQLVDIVAGGGNTAGVPAALDSFSRMIQSSGGTSPAELLNAFKTIAGTGMAIGQDPAHMMQIAALTSLRGLGTRIPTALRNDLLTVELARHGGLSNTPANQRKMASMRKMGLLDGSDDIFDQLGKIETYRAAHGGGDAAIAGAFGDRRGADAILTLTSPQMQSSTRQLRDQWSRLPSLSKDHGDRMESVNAQLAVFDTNLTSLKANMGDAIKFMALPGVKAGASVTAALANLAGKHPNLTAAGVGGGGVLGLGALGLGKLLELRGFLTLIKSMKNGGIPVFVVNSASAGIGGINSTLSGGAGGVAKTIGAASVFLGTAGAMYELITKREELRDLNAANEQKAKDNATLHAQALAALHGATKNLNESHKSLERTVKHAGGRAARAVHQAASASVGASGMPSSFSNGSVGPGTGGWN